MDSSETTPAAARPEPLPQDAPLRLRQFHPGDARGCAEVFHRAVHEGTTAHYGPEERAAWAPGEAADAAARLDDRLDAPDGSTWIALRNGRVCGFMSMGRDGHIDLAYVLPEEMGRGTARRLYFMLEAEARALRLTRMTTDASHLARSFFEKRGWQVEARQDVIRDGVALTNFRMFRDL